MTTNMLRGDVDLRAFYRWAGSRGMIGEGAFDPGFAMHCLLIESFGPDLAPKPFRLIIPRRSSRAHGTLYGYATAAAEELREVAGVLACPLQSAALPTSGILSKPIPGSWRPNQRLGFEILIRPVVRCARGSARAGREKDVFQAEAERCQPGEMRRTREDVYRDWLSTKLAQRGARLEEARLRSFQRTRVVRRLRSRATEGPDAIIQGTLEVVNPAEFAGLISKGVGRHRAYGYGMLLMRPASNKAR